MNRENGTSVTLDLARELERIEGAVLTRGEHIRTGAEARILRGTFLGHDVVIKERYPRTYRVTELDESLRTKRVRSEARLLVEAREIGLNTPRILDLDLVKCTLVLEYLPFPSLKETLMSSQPTSPPSPPEHEKSDEEQQRRYLIRETGRLVGLLHANDIIHGDLTTSNILVNGTDIWFIDFGLAEKTGEVEDKGVDLHVFTEAFESTHSAMMDLLDHFFAGYREANPEGSEDVIARAEEVAKRGRYS
jgi:Kae1-associated kinase Bud32